LELSIVGKKGRKPDRLYLSKGLYRKRDSDRKRREYLLIIMSEWETFTEAKAFSG